MIAVYERHHRPASRCSVASPPCFTASASFGVPRVRQACAESPAPQATNFAANCFGPILCAAAIVRYMESRRGRPLQPQPHGRRGAVRQWQLAHAAAAGCQQPLQNRPPADAALGQKVCAIPKRSTNRRIAARLLPFRAPRQQFRAVVAFHDRHADLIDPLRRRVGAELDGRMPPHHGHIAPALLLDPLALRLWPCAVPCSPVAIREGPPERWSSSLSPSVLQVLRTMAASAPSRPRRCPPPKPGPKCAVSAASRRCRRPETAPTAFAAAALSLWAFGPPAAARWRISA